MANSSTLLSNISPGLRDPLIDSYQEIAKNYSEHRWEPSELNGGKFCEVVFTIINDQLNGSTSTRPKKPNDMVADCRALEKISPNPGRVGDRSLRILIPRTLQVLYEIRNNRGVGHVGGDVDPNFLDATAVYSLSSWVLAELVRIFHGTSTQAAQEEVDALIERKHPLIWDNGMTRRVLDSGMEKGDQVLVLMHSKPSWVQIRDLFSWVEYSSLSMFRKRILEPFHRSRLLEYDVGNERARISPLGVKDVEERLLRTRP